MCCISWNFILGHPNPPPPKKKCILINSSHLVAESNSSSDEEPIIPIDPFPAADIPNAAPDPVPAVPVPVIPVPVPGTLGETLIRHDMRVNDETLDLLR